MAGNMKVAATKAETKEKVAEAGAKTEEKAAEARPPKRWEKEDRTSEWGPKTKLGQDVLKGKYANIEEILSKGLLILEPEIVDYLVPELGDEIIYIGGSPGKGGGIRRTATRVTARMHKSGRRFKLAALVVVGNEDGVVGLGRGSSKEHRGAIEKSTQEAKLSVINVKRGCGSWECSCGGNHSIPFKTEAKHGSIKVSLLPAPKGVGIVASEEAKKIIKLAGIKDIWVKTRGKTKTRINLGLAVFKALKNLSSVKGDVNVRSDQA